MKINARRALLAGLVAGTVGGLRAEDAYVEPGALRLTHELRLEGLFHRVSPGWREENDGLNKTYTKDDTANHPWTTEWGQTLLTEVATRLTPAVSGRVLFEADGDYADRFWRPINIENHIDESDRTLFVRQAEAKVDKEAWYAHAFKGVGHGDWQAQGDFFALYPASYPDDDYLGLSGYFGVYPDRYKQDLFLNISRRHAPNGVEAGAKVYGLDTAVAYGNELQWGYENSFYARVSAPFRTTSVTFVMKNEDVPFTFDRESAERNRAYAVAWDVPSEEGHRFDVGVLYNPFRLNQPYVIARDANAGEGLLGSSTSISDRRTRKKDAFAERARLERHEQLFQREVVWSLNLTHAGVVAGNKDQADFHVGTDLVSALHGSLSYTYRRPVEGPVPFLYEGTPSNIGAVASFPRGPESPFTVNWQNREAVFVTGTLVFDPTPGTRLFLYDPEVLQSWNLNKDENSPFTLAVQYRMSDYRTATDRQYYYNESGDIVWEPAARTGAWPSRHPLNEVRILAHGRAPVAVWTLGFAGGQSPALSGLAYTQDTTKNKPLTEYYSVEGRIDRGRLGLWGHYGTGVWGPEPFQYFFGESFDRLWGVGVSYNITPNTVVDVNYLAARQDDTLFVAPDLGSYDEIHFQLSHRFGFLYQFKEAARSGYEAR